MQPGNKLTQNSKTAYEAVAKEPNQGTLVNLGKLTFLLEDGALRCIRWNDVEVIRGLSASVRDANWGSLIAANIHEIREEEEGLFTFTRTYCHSNGALDLLLTICANSSGHLRAEFLMKAKNDVSINRAGLNVLHPILGVAGKPVEVHHSDDSHEELVFPEKIAPAQPVKDIVGLCHQIADTQVLIKFDGEVFEMEDQRNWSDASFKTYCRPLSLPFPFTVQNGQVIRQSVDISLSKAKDAVKPTFNAPKIPEDITGRAPDILLAIQPGWQPLGNLAASGLLLRIGADYIYEDCVLSALAKDAQQSGAYIDIEVVTRSQEDPTAEIAEIASVLREHGVNPRHVICLPSPYLKSYQPDGPWPDGPTPSQCAFAAATIFPKARVGVGALTNFTELNRCRPQEGVGDYITHGNSAIVHASDDRSVMETLEAIPQILKSGRSIAGNRGYRLGLMAIGMRTNPYGASLSPNPEQQRKTMTDDDPRQKSLFAAAYAIAIAVKTARHGIEAVTLAAPTGPLGTLNAQGCLYPIYHVVKALSNIAGRQVELIDTHNGKLRGIRFSGGAIIANCTREPVALENPPGAVAILDNTSIGAAATDENWIAKTRKTSANQVVLDPCACLFSGFEVAA